MGNFPEGQLQEGFEFGAYGWEFTCVWHPAQYLAPSTYPGSSCMESLQTRRPSIAERRWSGVRAGSSYSLLVQVSVLLLAGSVTWGKFLSLSVLLFPLLKDGDHCSRVTVRIR